MNINVVGEIPKQELSFFPAKECELTDKTFYINKSAVRDDVYFGYIYCQGIKSYSDNTQALVIECFTLFNVWRMTSNDEDYFKLNEFLKIV